MTQPSPAPWTYENVERPHDCDAYGVVKDAEGKILFDTLNSDVAEIHTEHDEGCFNRWDEQGRVNLTLAAAAPKLLSACKRFLDVARKYGVNWLELFGHDEELIAAEEAIKAAIAEAEAHS